MTGPGRPKLPKAQRRVSHPIRCSPDEWKAITRNATLAGYENPSEFLRTLGTTWTADAPDPRLPGLAKEAADVGERVSLAFVDLARSVEDLDALRSRIEAVYPE